MKRCDIIIPVWNEPDVTKECVDSISKYTAYPHRLIIIDNGSDKETEQYLKSLKDIMGPNLLSIRNDSNLGFVKAVNQGLKQSDAPYLCLMNNDTVAASGWLDEMVEVAETYPELGLVNPSSNTFGQSPNPGESIDGYASSLRQFKGKIQGLSTARGFSMLIKRDVLDRIGFLDESYAIGYFEETDYSRRARDAGYGIARAKAAYVYHKGSVSFKKIEESRALFEKNEKIFYKRWGRPVKIGLFLDNIESEEKIDRLARDMVNNGHQIWVFLKKGLPWPITLDHYEIRRINLNPHFFGMISIYKILKRAKKKKMDVILTYNKLLGSLLKLMAPAHGSDVIINPVFEEVAELVSRKSKIVSNERVSL